VEIRYLVSPGDLHGLAADLQARGVRPLHVTRGADGLWYSLLETEEAYNEPESNISAMLAAIQSLEAESAGSWSECTLREFNIGYDCGDEPWAFNQGLKTDTLHRIAALGATIRITLYPQRPPRQICESSTGISASGPIPARNEVEDAGKRRDIGAEVLQGLQEIKRGECGRVKTRE
jgi:hypothetical protein